MNWSNLIGHQPNTRVVLEVAVQWRRGAERARRSLASQSDLAEADPATADVLALELALGLLDLFLVFEEHQREASVLACLLLDDDVLLCHVESAKELNDFLDRGSPR
jgi:hypothetical protein